MWWRKPPGHWSPSGHRRAGPHRCSWAASAPAAIMGNAACFMGHCRLPDTLGLVGGGPVVPIPAPMQAILLHPTPRAVVTTCHPSPCSPGGHNVLPNPGAVLATRRKRADTHQLHADDKGRPCGSEVQDWDPGLGPFLRGGKGRGLPRVAPCSPMSGLLTGGCPQMGTRATARPRTGPPLQHPGPAISSNPRTPEAGSGQTQACKQHLQWGRGQRGAGTGALCWS